MLWRKSGLFRACSIKKLMSFFQTDTGLYSVHCTSTCTIQIIQYPANFFSNFLMKVHTEVHCGDTKRNPKFQVNTFILYQDMEILNCSVFLTVRLYFSTNCFQTAESLVSDKLRTVGIFAISEFVCELYVKEEFLFLTVF